jgi:hypothetical protein
MTTRNDRRVTGARGKKCGNSYIPASAQCNNGQGGIANKGGTEGQRQTGRVLQGIGATFGAIGAYQGIKRKNYAGAASNITRGAGLALAGEQYVRGNTKQGDKISNASVYAATAAGAAGLAYGTYKNPSPVVMAGGRPLRISGYKRSIYAGSAVSGIGNATAAIEAYRGNHKKAARRSIGSSLLGAGVAAGGVGYANSPGARAATKNFARRAGSAAGGVYGRARRAAGMGSPLRTVEGFAIGGSGPTGPARGARRRRAYGYAKAGAYAAGRATGRVANVFRRNGRPMGGSLGRRDSIWAEGFTMDPAVFSS